MKMKAFLIVVLIAAVAFFIMWKSQQTFRPHIKNTSCHRCIKELCPSQSFPTKIMRDMCLREKCDKCCPMNVVSP